MLYGITTIYIFIYMDLLMVRRGPVIIMRSIISCVWRGFYYVKSVYVETMRLYVTRNHLIRSFPLPLNRLWDALDTIRILRSLWT